jgi:hypothetical protein
MTDQQYPFLRPRPKRLTAKRLEVIVDALAFCIAGDWDASSHDCQPEDMEAALDWARQQIAKRENVK